MGHFHTCCVKSHAISAIQFPWENRVLFVFLTKTAWARESNFCAVLSCSINLYQTIVANLSLGHRQQSCVKGLHWLRMSNGEKGRQDSIQISPSRCRTAPICRRLLFTAPTDWSVKTLSCSLSLSAPRVAQMWTLLGNNGQCYNQAEQSITDFWELGWEGGGGNIAEKGFAKRSLRKANGEYGTGRNGLTLRGRVNGGGGGGKTKASRFRFTHRHERIGGVRK